MTFAKAYLEKVSLDPDIKRLEPSPTLSLVVAIPACNEPGIINTLECLCNCLPPEGDVEVIVALNSAEDSNDELIRQNQQSEKEITKLAGKGNQKLRILHFNQTAIRSKDAGAGYARKLAMDHAFSRFNHINKKDGVIISLDADTICESEYLRAVESHFRDKPATNACSVYFEHPLNGCEFSSRIYSGITQYELHLRYYVEGLRYAGHPHAYHTVGSAFAIRAGTYESEGGMNKRSAGEDFYFLQQLAKTRPAVT